jgi:ferredoxin
MSEETGKEKKGKKVEDIRKEAEEQACAVRKALYFVEEFIKGPMCSRCFPCSLGTGEAKIRLIRISQHLQDVDVQDILALKRIGLNMIEGSFCKKGKDTGAFLIEVLAASNEEFREHLQGTCPKRECISLVEYVIKPELCTMCGKCADVCTYGAIIGEKKQAYFSGYFPFEIRDKRCTQCGECMKVCPSGAIEIRMIQKEELVPQE